MSYDLWLWQLERISFSIYDFKFLKSTTGKAKQQAGDVLHVTFTYVKYVLVVKKLMLVLSLYGIKLVKRNSNSEATINYYSLDPISFRNDEIYPMTLLPCEIKE